MWPPQKEICWFACLSKHRWCCFWPLLESPRTALLRKQKTPLRSLARTLLKQYGVALLSLPRLIRTPSWLRDSSRSAPLSTDGQASSGISVMLHHIWLPDGSIPSLARIFPCLHVSPEHFARLHSNPLISRPEQSFAGGYYEFLKTPLVALISNSVLMLERGRRTWGGVLQLTMRVVYGYYYTGLL